MSHLFQLSLSFRVECVRSFLGTVKPADEQENLRLKNLENLSKSHELYLIHRNSLGEVRGTLFLKVLQLEWSKGEGDSLVETSGVISSLEHVLK